MDLNKLRDESFNVAKDKGWHDVDVSVGDRLCLMHSEISEALEEYRAGHQPNEIYFHGEKPEGVAIELVDVLIRILDFAGKYNIDIQKAYEIKTEFNKTRPYRHGGKKL